MRSRRILTLLLATALAHPIDSWALGADACMALFANFSETTNRIRPWKKAGSEIDRLMGNQEAAKVIAAAQNSARTPIPRLHFTSQTADLARFKQELGFQRIGQDSAEREGLRWPSTSAIEQIRVASRSDGPVLIVKPTIVDGVRTKYGTAPIIARLSNDGTISDVKPLFKMENHRLSNLQARHYDYTFAVNSMTGVVRTTLSRRGPNQASLYRNDSRGSSPKPDQADVFFVDQNGNELTPLSRALRARFRNAVDLNNNLFLVETTAGKFLFVEYSPPARGPKILRAYAPTPEDRRGFSNLFLNDQNRAGASALKRGSSLYIALGSHQIRVELNEANVSQGVTLKPLIRAMERIYEPSDRQPLKVIETVSTKGHPDYFMSSGEEILFYGGSQANERFIPRGTVSLSDPTSTRFSNWSFAGVDAGSTIYHVEGGFIVQRARHASDIITRPDRGLAPLPRRGLVYLQEGFGKVELQGLQGIGEWTVADGYVFASTPDGRELRILRLSDLIPREP